MQPRKGASPATTVGGCQDSAALCSKSGEFGNGAK